MVTFFETIMLMIAFASLIVTMIAVALSQRKK